MEEVGAQVAPPIFIHQNVAGGFYEGHPMAKKRSLPFQPQQPRWTSSGFQIPGNSWNPKAWDWDSVRFVVKPLESDALGLGTASSVQSDQQRMADKEDSGVHTLLNMKPVDEDDQSLRLKLGGSLNTLEDPVSRPNKRVRSGSPAGCNYPMCQVDNCREDLSYAKDYHRRHKVCVVHSKSSKALVGKQMQRFCQQCSRFHPLFQFDEGKRSCRRRLAGHNQRRRKTQTDDVSSQMLLPGNHDNIGNRDSDIVNLLTVLAHAQVDFEAKLPVSGRLSRTIPEQASSDNQKRLNRNMSSPSTKDLLAVLSATRAASSSDALTILSQRSSQGVVADKTKLARLDQASSLNRHEGEALEFPSGGGEKSRTICQSPSEDSDCEVQETTGNLGLQLFSSSPEDDSPPKLALQLFSSSPEDDSPPELACARNYISSDSSNPIEETSPSSSPPVVQKLIPMQTTRRTEQERISTGGEVNANVGTSKARGSVASFELFGRSNSRVDNGSLKSLPLQAGYTSSSGSDHSRSSLNSYAQDRTGRLTFKLFGKNPSQLPGTLRTQIYNWLSHSPAEMESYIRPGCVVLSIYISMSSSDWEQLEENLLWHVNSLVWDSDTDFWRHGRFLVHIGRQLASHKDGEIRLCKSWRAWHSPELISVSPLAVVGGEDTPLFLKGRNLNIPGTKIHCTHMGGYLSKEVPGSSSQETVYDEINLVSFKMHGVAPGVLGRCFIEVENGFKGTSFPVIIADATICQELRLLESEFDEGAKVHDTISEDQMRDFGRTRSKEEALHFLNELGWLFQRKRNSLTVEVPDYTLARFKFLFIFSVERDCCALVKTLLDILLERYLDREGPSREALEMLSEIHLLNRAVKRRCKNMVDLLIHYSVLSGDDTSKYIFLPNLVGPGGVTPLHLAACTSNSEDMVDALTSDPQEMGLDCWNSLLDANGLSPYAYALIRNNHAYNMLVAHKLAERKNGQVHVSIGNEMEQQRLGMRQDHCQRSPLEQGQGSCSKCAVVASRYNRRMPGSQGFLHRLYMHPILAIAAVCVCICLFLRGHPEIGFLLAPFNWKNLDYGPS